MMTLDDVMELSQMRDQTISWWLLHDAVKKYAAEQVAAEREAFLSLLRQLRNGLAPTYGLSQEGRAYLERIDAAIRARGETT